MDLASSFSTFLRLSPSHQDDPSTAAQRDDCVIAAFVKLAIPILGRNRRARRHQGWCVWRERKNGLDRWRARIGKRLGGPNARPWFPEEQAALAWVAVNLAIREEIGKAEWRPDRERLLEFERIAELHSAAIADGLPLPPLTQIVELAIRSAVRERELQRTTLDDVIVKWGIAKASKSREYRTKSLALYRRFALWYGASRAIGGVSVDDAEKWTKSLFVETDALNRYVRQLSVLWNWAAHPRRRYATENPWKALELETVKPKEVGFLTIAEVTRLLRLAAEEPWQPLLPFLVVALFCGPRVAESGRVDWSAISLARGKAGISINADIAKTARRRWVPLPSVAVAWLRLYSGSRTGPLVPRSLKFRRARLHRRAGFLGKARCSNNGVRLVEPQCKVSPRKWPKNGLRHTYCTYALAATRNPDEIAFCAGHDTAVLRSRYDGCAKPYEARAFYALLPKIVMSRRGVRAGNHPTRRRN